MTERHSHTVAEIKALSNEDILSHLDEGDKKLALEMAGLLDPEPPKKRADESAAGYRQRIREDAETYKAEFALSFRSQLEDRMWDNEQKQRMIDAMASGVTEESQAAMRAADEARARRDAVHDSQYGRPASITSFAREETHEKPKASAAPPPPAPGDKKGKK